MRFFFIVYDAQRRFNISVAGKKLNVNVMLTCGQAVKLVNFYDCGGAHSPIFVVHIHEFTGLEFFSVDTEMDVNGINLLAVNSDLQFFQAGYRDIPVPVIVDDKTKSHSPSGCDGL